MSESVQPAGTRLGDGLFAEATERPESIDALREVVTRRAAEGRALYPQGGGTALDYGGTPRSPGVAVDTRGLNRVIDYPAADMTITLEAGITIASLSQVLREQRQRLLIDAPHPERATLGGIYATNANGSRRYGAGSPRDQIIGVGFVTSDGEVVKGGGRVVKNVAGYDFPKLITGSMGTLGIISHMTLAVRPMPEASALVWAPIPSPDRLESILEALNTSGTRPIALDVLNRGGAMQVGGALGMPQGDCVLVLGFEDNDAAVAWSLERLKDELVGIDFATKRQNDSESLWLALTAFQSEELGPVSFVANLRRSSVAEFVAGLDPEHWAVQAHAGNGIVRAHALTSRDREAFKRDIDYWRARAVRDGGNLILSRCPAEWKPSLKVWGEPRGDWGLMERLKQSLDPKAIMNPGRFVGTI
ncbi:FAD-binding oxidoreductase [Singulisphaera sp. PoT]|uniref:FAD-binding oxidoreductase n=1 Tax=Singulisphaera sp. PoT TaxID=3411797 RepID=UPI003BF4E7DB